MAIVSLIAGATATVTAPAGAAAAAVSDIRATIVTLRPPEAQWAGTQEYDRTNITYEHTYARPDDLHIELGGGTLQHGMELDVAAAPGSLLQTGTSASGDRDEGAQASLYMQYRSCPNVRFVITDFARDGDTVSRYDVKFWTNCGSASQQYADIYGEVSYGYGDSDRPVVTGTRDIGWPSTPVGSRARTTIPIWLRNTGTNAREVGSPSVAGTDAGDFSIATTTCLDVLLPGDSCSLSMAFVPRAAGVRTGSISVPVGDTTVTTTLTGDAPAGRTFLRLTGQRGEYVTEGQSYLFTDAHAPMTIGDGGAYGFDGAVTDDVTDDGWGVRLFNRAAPMTLGTHAVDSWHDDTQYNLSVWGQGRGCNGRYGSVTISQLTFTPEGVPATFDATFTQHCEGPDRPALTGEIAYRAAPTITTPVSSLPTSPRASARTKPRITRQPHTQTARYGHSGQLQADASGTPAPTVTWQVSRDRGRHWTTVRHATTRSLRVKLSHRNAAYRYRARFANSAGVVFTHTARLRPGRRR